MSEKITINAEDLQKIIGEKFAKSWEEKSEQLKKSTKTPEEQKKEREELIKSITDDNEKKINDAIAKAQAKRKTEVVKGITDTTDQVIKSVDGKTDYAASRKNLETIILKSDKLNRQPMTDWEKDLRYYSDRVFVLKSILERKNKLDEIDKYSDFNLFKSHIAKAGTQWDSTAGDGLELIPTVLSNQVLEDTLALGGLFSKIQRITVPAKFELSRLDDQMQFFKGAILTAPTSSTPATAKASFNADKILGYAKIAYETDQDTIAASVNFLMSALPRQFDGAIEEVLISGDDAGTHQDADIQAVANHSAKTFDGLRRIAIDNSWTKDLSGNFVANSIRDMRAPLTTRSIRAFKDSVWIFSGNVYEQARQIASTRTMDVIGSGATNLGPLTTLDGSEVLLSEFMREDVNSLGVNATTTAGATKASCIYVDLRHFLIGQIAPMLIETDRNITSQQIDLVLSIRLDFQQVLSSTKRPMTLGINVTKI